MIHRFENEKGKNALQITEEELGGNEGMDNITKNYYTNQLNTISDEAMRKKAVELIEDKLIVDERRISLPEVLLLNEGYSKELLDYLLNTTRLIRIDNDRYVEISHDRLLSSILKSKEQRMEEENKSREIKNLQRLREEEEEKNRLLQKQKEEEIKKLEFEFLKDKVKKAKRLRIYLYILIMLLAGFLYATIDASKSDIKARILLALSFESEQKLRKADSVLNTINPFSLLNFYNKDSLKLLRMRVKNEIAIQDRYTEYISKGDSLLQAASFLITPTDSLLLIADSIARQKTLGNKANFADISSKMEKMLDIEVEGLLRANDYYLMAQQTGYYSNDADISPGLKLKDVLGKMSYPFSQCLDAASIFLKANDKQDAKTAFEKSQRIYLFATDSSRNINNSQLNPDDIPYFDKLKKHFNEK